MTRPIEPMADLAIPPAILRHLDGIEAELPRTPRWRPTRSGDARLHVVRARIGPAGPPSRRSRFALEPVMAAAMIAALVGGGLLVAGPQEPPGRLPTPTAPVVMPQFTPRSNPSSDASLAPASTKPQPSRPEIIAPGGETDAATLIARRLNWACRLHTDAGGPRSDLRAVDKIAETQAVREGWVVAATKERFWLGTDIPRAAQAFGAVLVARDSAGGTWIAIGTGDDATTFELVAERTPAGRLTWRLGDSERAAACRLESKLRANDGKSLLTGVRDPQLVLGYRFVARASLHEPAPRAS